MKYALEATGHVLDLSNQFATQMVVNGVKGLLNEITNKLIPCPIIDHLDMEYLQNAFEIYVQPYAHVLVDEAHDLTKNQKAGYKKAVPNGGSEMLVSDVSQTMNQWLGVEIETLQECISGAEEYMNVENWRSSKAIIRDAQQVLDIMGRKLIIKPMRDVEGSVYHESTFHALPIDLKESTLLLCRTIRDSIAFYSVLIAKGYPVEMHGLPNTVVELTRIVEALPEPLGLAQHELKLIAAKTCTSDHNLTADLQCSLIQLIDTFLKDDPSLDAEMPGTKHDFLVWLGIFFSVKGESRVGKVNISTIHGAKGLEADRVIIGQPDSCPMQRRLDLGGWNEHEERCVEFVMKTRARNIMQYLVHLENCNREEILELFDPP